MKQLCRIVYQELSIFDHTKGMAIKKFEEQINALLLEGYKLVGGFCLDNDCLYQLMTIEEKEI
jgi:hypothetical protein